MVTIKVKVLYDKYNTKIEKATLLFGEDLEQQSIELTVLQESIGEIESPTLASFISIKSIDADKLEVINKLTKEDLRVFLSLIRNLLNQL